MANKRTRTITQDEYKLIIETIRNGFIDKNGAWVRGNRQVEIILQLQANLGLRVSDSINMTLNNIKKDGSRYKLDLIEKKTGKRREFTIPVEIFTFIQSYAIENNIKKHQKLVNIGVRQVQNILKKACDHLGLEDVATHSMRKYYGTQIYNNNGHNIELCRHLLMHSSITTTQRYIGVSADDVEKAIESHIEII